MITDNYYNPYICDKCHIHDIKEKYYEIKIRLREVTGYLTLSNGEQVGEVYSGEEKKYKVCEKCYKKMGFEEVEK